jgi:type IV conjugative transfer system coupling protein TraD
MSFMKHFTQGGQVTLHNIRMIRQVINVTFVTSLLISLAFFGLKTWSDHTSYQIKLVFTYVVAEIKTSIPFGDNTKKMQEFTYPNGRKELARSIDILQNKWVNKQIVMFQKMIIENIFVAILIFFGIFIVMIGFWVWRGCAKSKKKILSGGNLVPIEKLILSLRKSDKASDIELSGLPLIKDSETKHMMIVGTTGAGKTNTFNHLLPQIRDRNQKAIIVDTTGTFVEKYYNPETDILLNPLDERSAKWDLWKECKTDVQIDDFASSLIPQTLHDQFWSDASRLLFSQTIKILQKRKACSIKKLLDYAIHKPLVKIQGFYAGTPAASLVDIAADKTAASIRITLSTHLKSIHLMNDKEDGFSIQEWIKDDSQRGWLFLVSMPDQRETLRPLMSSWLNIAINSLMACKPSQDRRLWFIIDEKQSLNKIEALPKALAEIRKYGGCIVAGLQNISQLDKLYGHESRKTMSSLYNTKIFFRSPDTDTAQWISKMIGEHEVLENNEGISFGAHQMRDGVSLTEHKKQKAIVPYSELLNLKDLEAYIKLPEDYPVSKLTFKYKEIESKNEAFIERQFNLESESTCEDNTVNLEIFDEEVDDHVSDNGKKINLLRIG